MKSRSKRLVAIVGGLAALGIATALVLNAFNSNLVFFFSPTQVAANEAPQGLHLALKSGNFGSDDFFMKAFQSLSMAA